MQSLPQFFSPTCPKANFRNKIIFIQTKKKQKNKNFYSNKFFHNFHLSEFSFTFPWFRASGLV